MEMARHGKALPRGLPLGLPLGLPCGVLRGDSDGDSDVAGFGATAPEDFGREIQPKMVVLCGLSCRFYVDLLCIHSGFMMIYVDLKLFQRGKHEEFTNKLGGMHQTCWI